MTRQFDVFENPSTASRGFAPYVLVLQSHHLPLDTVVAAPLVVDKLATSVEPNMNVGGVDYVLGLTEMASIECARLKRRIANLSDQEDLIRAALSRVFTGF